ncbi:MAG: c-type cytochrome [Proteobacteria bacterium]|nr:c-type cytochrome [Pseudomonadota bacterium]
MSGIRLRVMAVLLLTAPVASAEPVAAVDEKRGRLLYLQCRACHALQPGGAALAGPHLGGLLGREVASVPGFSYSAALRAQSFRWDRARLDRWLEVSGSMVPGNSMAFAGITNAPDRAALIAYLAAATALPAIPAAPVVAPMASHPVP